MTLYRYERSYMLDDKSTPRVILEEYEVKRETEKCFVIQFFSKDRFILKKAKKRFAYPTKELALINFKLRTDKCISILKNQLNNAILFKEDALKINL